MADRPHRRDDAFLAEIARQYNAHVAAKWPPVRAISVAYGVNRNTASGWVVMARRRGHQLALGATGLRHNYPHRSIA